MKSGITLIIRVLFVLGAISVAASELAFAADTKDYWAETGITDTHLKKFLTQTRCYANENSFVGCVNAINAILASGYPKKILTNKNIENMPIMGSTILNIERLKINFYVYQKSKDTDIEVITKSWRAVYQLTKANPLAIEKIVSESLNYTKQDFKAAKIAFAINEYYKMAVDPHTSIIPISLRQKIQSTSENSVVGIGVSLQQVKNSVILSPKSGSPALSAGIKLGDILLQVNHQDIAEGNLTEVTNMITGEENSPVSLTVSRKGKKLSFNLLRKKFVEANIEVQVINDLIDNDQVGYIRLRNFTEEGICKKFTNAAIALYNNGKRSLVLDLRGNRGGLVSEGVCLASKYLDKGSTIYTENDPATNKVKATHKVTEDALLYQLYQKPLIILIDADSASASEMVSGSLRAYSRAILIGERSYGKGTMQGQFAWKDMGGIDSPDLKDIGIMKTIARFHFANGESNQLVGLTPDITVHKEASLTTEASNQYREKDLYPNAISNSSYKTYVPKPKIKSLNICIAGKTMVDPLYAEKRNSHLVPDYQMSIAAQAASCL